MYAGDDYPSAGAGGNRPLLPVIAGFLPFVIARNGGDEAISLAKPQSLISPVYLYVSLLISTNLYESPIFNL
jgi:hypothetical protein